LRAYSRSPQNCPGDGVQTAYDTHRMQRARHDDPLSALRGQLDGAIKRFRWTWKHVTRHPGESESVANEAIECPRFATGSSVKTICDAYCERIERSPAASLSPAKTTTATYGPLNRSWRCRSCITASRLNGTCAPSRITDVIRDAWADVLGDWSSTRSIRPGRRALACTIGSRRHAPSGIDGTFTEIVCKPSRPRWFRIDPASTTFRLSIVESEFAVVRNT
jgi:hypothetical protein